MQVWHIHFLDSEMCMHILGSVTMKTSFDKNAYVPGEAAQARLKLMHMNYVCCWLSRCHNKCATNVRIPWVTSRCNRWSAAFKMKALVRSRGFCACTMPACAQALHTPSDQSHQDVADASLPYARQPRAPLWARGLYRAGQVCLLLARYILPTPAYLSSCINPERTVVCVVNKCMHANEHNAKLLKSVSATLAWICCGVTSGSVRSCNLISAIRTRRYGGVAAAEGNSGDNALLNNEVNRVLRGAQSRVLLPQY